MQNDSAHWAFVPVGRDLRLPGLGRAAEVWFEVIFFLTMGSTSFGGVSSQLKDKACIGTATILAGVEREKKKEDCVFPLDL